MKPILISACLICVSLPVSPVSGSDGVEASTDSYQVSIEVVEVLDDGSEKVQDRHLVLFNEGKSYDFALLEPHDVTVVDPKRERVTLLSRESHVKSTLASTDLTAAAARVRAFAADVGKEDMLGIKAEPKRLQTDPNDGTESRYGIEFAGIRYEAVGVPSEVASQPVGLAEFTDWAAKVNVIRKLGTPPFARMKLGRKIAADNLVPSEITLHLTSNGQKRTFRSRYEFRSGLSDEDRARLDKVAGMITLYAEVPLESFPR